MARTAGLRWLALAAWSLLGACAADLKRPDALEDDAESALRKLRQRLKEPISGTYGIAILVDPRHKAWSDITLPLWRKYAAHHGFGLFEQHESLNTNVAFEWSKPRLLMELLPKVPWKYTFVVEPSSLPGDFNRSWESVVQLHMRHKRFKNDDAHKRVVFCPHDCEEEYEDALREGACHGPILTGCVFQSSKSMATEIAKLWYKQRKDGNPIARCLDTVKDRHYDEIFFRDVPKEMGRKYSKFLPSFGYDEKYGWDVRAQVLKYLESHPKLAARAREAEQEAEEAKARATSSSTRKEL
eukprot:TRINITY_DN12801_c1_g1_i1.p1 TRINITY_DN12801_c1_g1~~TRINITY_DN12801_c1_g1_i1.p1  ORF type:complete len:298 (+),score=71.19 TRINITY_DN12801_c1_g1_i1:92-985(+)